MRPAAWSLLLLLLLLLLLCCSSCHALTPEVFQRYGLPVSAAVLREYGHFPAKWRSDMRDTVKEMFYFGYDNYLQHAYPLDELNPVDCSGRGPDWNDVSNINVNDVLGNYSLTLVDSLDALLVFGNVSEFHRAVNLVIDNVSFDQDTTVQVFEATIRVLGGLLSAHLLLNDTNVFSDTRLPGYDGELLSLAIDLADRLTDAFHGTATGLPHPRVNLRYGVQPDMEKIHETCLAGAGSLLVEFGLLSHLSGDSLYGELAQKSTINLINRRNEKTQLLGNTLDIRTGQWLDLTSGVGAGMDSFYEYLLKAYVLFGDEAYLNVWNELYEKIKLYHRIGGSSCGADSTAHPLYINTNMATGSTSNAWVDSLAAAFPALQVLSGDLGDAICLHNFYTNVWRLFGALPERFNWNTEQAQIPLYPLRPELAESTYFLYRATKNPFYLHVGMMMVESLNGMARTKCGFATVHSVLDKTLEDRMESFFLSETLKYLYLLFDEDNPVNRHEERLLFTTEGHILPLSQNYQTPLWSEVDIDGPGASCPARTNFCTAPNPLLRYALPVDNIAWKSNNNDPGRSPLCSQQ